MTPLINSAIPGTLDEHGDLIRGDERDRCLCKPELAPAVDGACPEHGLDLLLMEATL